MFSSSSVKSTDLDVEYATKHYKVSVLVVRRQSVDASHLAPLRAAEKELKQTKAAAKMAGQALFFVGALAILACCQAQQVSKSIKTKAKNCFPEVNGAKINDTGRIISLHSLRHIGS